MAVHLLRFDPDVASVAAWFSAEGLAPRDQDDEGYGWHALFTATFGEDLAPKPFRVLARRGRSTQVLAYAQADAAALRARAADFADPKVVAALGVTSLASKPMPTFIAGRLLGFSARIRPTVRTDRDGDRTRSRELDVFVAAKLAATSGQALDKGSVYAEWARRKLNQAGVEVKRLRIDGLESSDIVRRGRGRANGSRPLRRIPGHAVTVAGTSASPTPTASPLCFHGGSDAIVPSAMGCCYCRRRRRECCWDVSGWRRRVCPTRIGMA
jgi:CRISPR system Cascade subunit CasE